MKINFMCSQCIMLASSRGNTYQINDGVFVDMPISDSGIYEFHCDTQFHHNNKIIINNLKSDLLYDSAINAYNDGYLRESISSFYAALENFYIETTKYLLSKAPNSISDEKRDKLFKSHIKLSERKLGSFYILYLFILNQSPPEFHNDHINLRNKVIHGTYYPTNDDVVKFGKAVAEYIFLVITSLKVANPNAFNDIVKVNLPSVENPEQYSATTQRAYLSFYQDENNQPVIDFIDFTTNYANNKK